MSGKSWHPQFYMKQGFSEDEAKRLASAASSEARVVMQEKGIKHTSWKSRSYWLNKGFKEAEVDAILNFDLNRYDQQECSRLFGSRAALVYDTRQINLARVSRVSPFSREFWMKKGMTEQEADFKRNSMRPIRPEYWICQGYSESEANIKAAETKAANNKKGATASGNRPKESIQKSSKRCVEYYLARGYDLQEATQLVSEAQATFSLVKCVSKHGPLEGYQIWLNRQIKWQNSLKSKLPQDIEKMNKKKNAYRLELFDSVDRAIDIWNNGRNTNLVKTLSEFDSIVKNKINNGFFHTTIEWFFDMQVPQVQKQILDLDLDQFKARYGDLFYTIPPQVESRVNWHRKTKKTGDGFLRSSLEIYFYDMFFKNKLDTKFKLHVDKRYPDSSFRYDFMLTQLCNNNTLYVEVCPLLHNPYYEQYTEKMLTKRTLFNCHLLSSKTDIDIFIKGLN